MDRTFLTHPALHASVNVAELMGEVYKNVEIEPSLIQLKQPHSFFSSQQTDTEKTLLVDVSGVGVFVVLSREHCWAQTNNPPQVSIIYEQADKGI